MKIKVPVEYEEADNALLMFLLTSVIFELDHLIKKNIWTKNSKSVLFLYN